MLFLRKCEPVHICIFVSILIFGEVLGALQVLCSMLWAGGRAWFKLPCGV